MTTATSVQDREEQLVVFKLAGELYGIPITLVHEIIRLCDITQIPLTPEYVRGVVNLRGKIVPVVDLRRRMGLPLVEEASEARIVVVEVEQDIVGMIVDAVTEVLRLPASQIETPSELVADVAADLVQGVGKHGESLIILLDIEKMMRIQD